LFSIIQRPVLNTVLASCEENRSGERQPETKMKKHLKNYVGRIVRLNKDAFQKIKEQAARSGEVVENYFLVASFSRQMRKLICYGGNMRIAVSLSDVALV